MRWICLFCITLLSQACVNHTQLAQEAVEGRLLSPGKLTYRSVEEYPGNIVCGEYTASKKSHKTSFQAFIYVSSDIIMRPTREDQAVFCSQNAQQGLYESSGISFSEDSLLLIREDYNLLEKALHHYLADNLWLPNSRQGLDALLHPSEIAPEPRAFRDGGYIKKVPVDPWGVPYLYTGPKFAGVQGGFTILTLGADGKKGGKDDNADVEWHHLRYIDHIDKLN